MKKGGALNHLHISALHSARFNFAYVALFAMQTIVFHATKVITPELLLKRWVGAAVLLVVTAIAWLIAKSGRRDAFNAQAALSLIIFADIAFAVFNTYTQRGYASKSVLLFIIPIVIAASFMNRAALLVTALLTVAAYTTTAIAYFVLNFNEGYMSEMYAEIGFYSALFVFLAGLLWSLTRHRQ